jgi:TPR repeat protein
VSKRSAMTNGGKFEYFYLFDDVFTSGRHQEISIRMKSYSDFQHCKPIFYENSLNEGIELLSVATFYLSLFAQEAEGENLFYGMKCLMNSVINGSINAKELLDKLLLNSEKFVKKLLSFCRANDSGTNIPSNEETREKQGIINYLLGLLFEKSKSFRHSNKYFRLSATGGNILAMEKYGCYLAEKCFSEKYFSKKYREQKEKNKDLKEATHLLYNFLASSPSTLSLSETEYYLAKCLELSTDSSSFRRDVCYHYYLRAARHGHLVAIEKVFNYYYSQSSPSKEKKFETQFQRLTKKLRTEQIIYYGKEIVKNRESNEITNPRPQLLEKIDYLSWLLHGARNGNANMQYLLFYSYLTKYLNDDNQPANLANTANNYQSASATNEKLFSFADRSINIINIIYSLSTVLMNRETRNLYIQWFQHNNIEKHIGFLIKSSEWFYWLSCASKRGHKEAQIWYTFFSYCRKITIDLTKVITKTMIITIVKVIKIVKIIKWLKTMFISVLRICHPPTLTSTLTTAVTLAIVVWKVCIQFMVIARK